ncbi:MAG: long-chain fatty acid--CoA ligase [Denitrovibrio sp.]|nr:MAG: long-chain fatty acid--CoA ligase [Denitrovibrio sp.]
MHIEIVHQCLETQAKKHARKKFLFFNEDTYTYSEVNKRANKLSALLSEKGLQKGDRVAIMLENSPEFFFSYFAILKAGAIVVPVNTFLKQEEVAYMVNDSGSKFFITSQSFDYVAAGITEHCSELQAVMAFTETSFDSENIFVASEDKPDSNPETIISTDDLALFIYSSGTTGHPKGAMLTHFNLTSNAQGCCARFKISVKDRFLLFLPAFHSYAMMTCVVLPTYVVSSIIILGSVNDLKKKTFKKILLYKRPTFFLGVPQVYIALIKSKMPKFFIKFLYPIRLHVSGGAPLPEEILDQFRAKFNKPIIEVYGLSEASPVVSANSLKVQKPLSVGPALKDVEVLVVDENEKAVPVGEVGELIVKGPNVMKGYWNMPELTQKTLRNGWLFTGDLAKVDKEGYIYIVDRIKDLIIVKGINVYPREIEEVLHKHEKVEAAAVIGLPDKSSGEIPVAYVKIKDDVEATEKELKTYLKEHLANYKLPKHIHMETDLPMTATGKILKRELKDKVLNG